MKLVIAYLILGLSLLAGLDSDKRVDPATETALAGAVPGTLLTIELAVTTRPLPETAGVGTTIAAGGPDPRPGLN